MSGSTILCLCTLKKSCTMSKLIEKESKAVTHHRLVCCIKEAQVHLFNKTRKSSDEKSSCINAASAPCLNSTVLADLRWVRVSRKKLTPRNCSKSWKMGAETIV